MLDIWGNSEFDITITEACKFQVRSENPYERDLHCHRGYELNYVNFGLCIMEIGGSFISMHQGDCVVISPGISHSFMKEFQRGCDITQFEYDMRLPRKSGTFFRFLYGERPYEAVRSGGILRGMVEELYHGFHESAQAEFRKTYLELGFAQLYWVFANMLLESEKTSLRPEEPRRVPARTGSGKEGKALGGLLQYVNQNYDTKINIEMLAESFGVSSRSIRKYFSKQVGMSCIDYITMLRMEKARQMLWRTDKTITEIAFAVGYSSQQYFGNVFRRYTGLSPGRFRKQLREESGPLMPQKERENL